MTTRAGHWTTAILYVTALFVGVAFVYGGYWMPDVELRVVLSVPAIAALGTLVWRRVTLLDSPLPWPKLTAGASVAIVWLVLASTPYGVRLALFHVEAASLPEWKNKQPFWQFHVIADNSIDYEGLQIAGAPREEVKAFYRQAMAAGGWELKRQFVASPGDIEYLIFAKGNRKIAFHLGRTWDGYATAVGIFRVSTWPGAHEPGTGRRAWYQLVDNAF